MPVPEHQEPKRASLLQVAKAVFWSFFGVRKRKHYEEDSANLNPVYLIIAGLIGAALFIGTLVMVVRFAVS